MKKIPTDMPEATPSGMADFWHILIIFLVVCFASLPFSRPQLIITHETLNPLVRLAQLHKFFGDGQFYVRWMPDLSFGYGYPLFNFYAPLFYYAAEIFVLAGLGLITSLYASCFFWWLASGLGMYLFGRVFLGRRGALVAAVAYVLAPYHIADVYVRAAFAEMAGLAFFPFILWVVWKLFETKRWTYAVGTALLIGALTTAHNIMAFLFAPVTAAYAALLYFRAASNEDRALFLRQALWAFGLGLGVSAFFWMPALLEKKFISIAAAMTVGYFKFSDHFVYPDQLIWSPWGFGMSLPGRADGMSFAVGVVHLALAIAAVVFWRRAKDKGEALDKQMLFFSILTAGSLFFTTALSWPFWKILPLFSFIQFPWRFLSLAIFGISFLAGALVRYLPSDQDMKRACVVTSVAVLFLGNIALCWPRAYYPPDIQDKPTLPLAHINNQQLSSFAYFFWDFTPRWVKKPPDLLSAGQLSLTQGQASVFGYKRHSSVDQVFQIQATQDTRARYNVFYFPGWQVLIDERPVPIDPDNEIGVMDFVIPAGNHEVRLVWTQTPLRQFARTVSWAALGVLAGMFFWARWPIVFFKRPKKR